MTWKYFPTDLIKIYLVNKLCDGQYVALPPDKSKTAPVEKEFSSEQSQVIIEAASFTSRKRPRGILLSIKSICS